MVRGICVALVAALAVLQLVAGQSRRQPQAPWPEDEGGVLQEGGRTSRRQSTREDGARPPDLDLDDVPDVRRRYTPQRRAQPPVDPVVPNERRRQTGRRRSQQSTLPEEVSSAPETFTAGVRQTRRQRPKPSIAVDIPPPSRRTSSRQTSNRRRPPQTTTTEEPPVPEDLPPPPTTFQEQSQDRSLLPLAGDGLHAPPTSEVLQGRSVPSRPPDGSLTNDRQRDPDETRRTRVNPLSGSRHTAPPSALSDIPRQRAAQNRRRNPSIAIDIPPPPSDIRTSRASSRQTSRRRPPQTADLDGPPQFTRPTDLPVRTTTSQDYEPPLLPTSSFQEQPRGSFLSDPPGVDLPQSPPPDDPSVTQEGPFTNSYRRPQDEGLAPQRAPQENPIPPSTPRDSEVPRSDRRRPPQDGVRTRRRKKQRLTTQEPSSPVEGAPPGIVIDLSPEPPRDISHPLPPTSRLDTPVSPRQGWTLPQYNDPPPRPVLDAENLKQESLDVPVAPSSGTRSYQTQQEYSDDPVAPSIDSFPQHTQREPFDDETSPFSDEQTHQDQILPSVTSVAPSGGARTRYTQQESLDDQVTPSTGSRIRQAQRTPLDDRVAPPTNPRQVQQVPLDDQVAPPRVSRTRHVQSVNPDVPVAPPSGSRSRQVQRVPLDDQVAPPRVSRTRHVQSVNGDVPVAPPSGSRTRQAQRLPSEVPPSGSRSRQVQRVPSTAPSSGSRSRQVQRVPVESQPEYTAPQRYEGQPEAENAIQTRRHSRRPSPREPETPSQQSPQQQRKTQVVHCPESFGYFPDRKQCDKYVECRNGTGTEGLCPDGLVFNPTSAPQYLRCDSPRDIDCSDRPELQPAQPSPNCPRRFGIFAHESDCRRFWNCVEGQATEITCPEGLVYNDDRATCDWPDLVTRCDTEELLGFTCPDAGDEPPRAGEYLRYPHPTDCRLHFACIPGPDAVTRPRQLTCTEGLVFDPETSSCEKASLVKGCEDYYGEPETQTAAPPPRSTSQGTRRRTSRRQDSRS